MKREIKFRAWDKFTDKMWRWEEHNAFSTDRGSIKQWFEDKDLIPMQYVGLVDKNGKEIYEGDILNTKDYGVTTVSFLNASFCVDTPKNKYKSKQTIGVNIAKRSEILGNIYENKGLLK